MSDAAIAMATFPSRDNASAAIARLVAEGFARNSMELDRVRDGYRVAIHTRRANYDRVQSLLAEQPGLLAAAAAFGTAAVQTVMEAARAEAVQHAVEAATGAVVTTVKAHPALTLGTLGAGALAGFALYKIMGGRGLSLGIPGLTMTNPNRRPASRNRRSAG